MHHDGALLAGGLHHRQGGEGIVAPAGGRVYLTRIRVTPGCRVHNGIRAGIGNKFAHTVEIL